MTSSMRETNYKRAKLWLLVYLMVLSLIVLTPNEGDNGLVFGIFSLTESLERISNVFLLMPLPILLLNSFPKVKRTFVFVLGPALTCSIETIQLIVPGRVTDLWDVATNSLGYFLALLVLVCKSRSLHFPTGI
jgi:glycopeptide antibiotics resistance protein